MSRIAGSVPEEMLLGQYIPLHYHFNMLQDRGRMDAFQAAIEFAVPPGGRVLELGGGTGVLSYFAAQQAGQVWCVERNPALVAAARRFLKANDHGHRVEVVQADAMTYLPPEPVDVVICEMLHVGLLREKQTDVLTAFKRAYQRQFGPQLPVFIPDASLLAVQLVEQDFCFNGYHAAVPLFQPPGMQTSSRQLSQPEIYSSLFYSQEIPREFHIEQQFLVTAAGELNAVSFQTKNFLAFRLAERSSIDWMMNHLILPLPGPLTVTTGDQVTVRFHYQAGSPLETLQESLEVQRGVGGLQRRRAA